MCRPHGGLGRGPLAPSPKFLRSILQRVANSSLAEQRCPVPSRDRAPRRHHIATCPRRSSSPILQNLIFGTHRFSVSVISPSPQPRLGRTPSLKRLIGSIRRECVDHIIVFSEAQLRRILTKYAAYYNELRTNRSLNKDAPFHRAIQRLGAITSQPRRTS